MDFLGSVADPPPMASLRYILLALTIVLALPWGVVARLGDAAYGAETAIQALAGPNNPDVSGVELPSRRCRTGVMPGPSCSPDSILSGQQTLVFARLEARFAQAYDVWLPVGLIRPPPPGPPRRV